MILFETTVENGINPNITKCAVYRTEGGLVRGNTVADPLNPLPSYVELSPTRIIGTMTSLQASTGTDTSTHSSTSNPNASSPPDATSPSAAAAAADWQLSMSDAGLKRRVSEIQT